MQIREYSVLPDEAAQIREEVFVKEQGFRDEFDDIDKIATHIVIFDGDTAAATCRVFAQGDTGHWLVGRVAVRKTYRGTGLGRVLMQAAEKTAKRGGATVLDVSAQVRARGFYEAVGFTSSGEEYLDEYCPHIHMEKEL